MGRVLALAWDGRMWYARVDQEEQEKADGSEWHHTWSIELISPKGVARRIASFPRDTECIGGSLSPDGRYLVCALQAYGMQERLNGAAPISIFLMRSDGMGKRKVATADYIGDAPGWVYRASWSPDSSRVAIAIRSEGRNRIALVSVPDGAMQYLATPEWADVTCPDWSPDGRSVAYSCEDRRWKPEKGEGTDWTSFRWFVWFVDYDQDEAARDRGKRKRVRPASIWVTDLKSGESRRVTKTPETDVVDLLPRWSPGGTRIAYARWEWCHEFGPMHYWWLDLRVVEANGTSDQAITAPIHPPEWGWGATQVSAAEGDVEWLPDGRRIVFRGCMQGAEGRATGLAMVRVDGTHAWSLTPGMTGWPRISLESRTGFKHTAGLLVESFAVCPDGTYVAASGALWAGEAPGVWKVPIPVSALDKE